MGIAHEVSTPLGVIVGRAEQLGSRVAGDDRAAHGARVILEQAERIRLLVRRFLDLARGGAPALDRVASSSVVRGAVALVDHRFAKAGIKLMTDIPTELPMIQCDPALLEHALVNLLLNACEACTSGGNVEISARSDGQHVAFVVTDDGTGITPEDAARATEPFFTTKPEGVGTGLGLAIASEIVKSHRGALTIEPRSPRGTRALVEIPVSSYDVGHAA
jgi:two-component system, NtrC family, sensor kinase